VSLCLWLASSAACGTIGVDLLDLPFGDGDEQAGSRLDASSHDAPDDGGGDGASDGAPEAMIVDDGGDPLDGSAAQGGCGAPPLRACSADAQIGDGAADLHEADAGDRVDDAGRAAFDAGPTARDAGATDASLPVDAATDAAASPVHDAALDPCDGMSPPAIPLVHLALDETTGTVAKDARKFRNGSVINGPGSWTSGHIDGALQLDGVDDYVSVGNVGTAKSIALWLFVDSYGVTADQTGFRFPTSTGTPANQWTNPNFAYADDGKNAQATGLLGGATQDWGSFGLNVPSAVTGIEVMLDMQSVALNLLANTAVSLSANAGGAYTAACSSSQILSLGGTLYTCGGPKDTWGRSWSAGELSDANFRARVSFSVVLGTLNLDYLAVNVHYAPFTTGRGVLNLNASTRVSFVGQSLTTSGFPGGTQLYVDGVLGAQLDSGWHHVVIASPSGVSMNAVELGRALSTSPSFAGRLDDVRFYIQTLGPAEIDALHNHVDCAP